MAGTPGEPQPEQQTVCTELLQGFVLAARTGPHPTNAPAQRSRGCLGKQTAKSLLETTDFVSRAETGGRRVGGELETGF